MAMNLVIQPHNQQIDALEGVENGLRRRSCRGSFRVPRIQTRQPFFLFGQLPPHLKLHHCQQTQGQRQETNQTHRSVFTLQIHRLKRQAFPFQATEVSFHQIFFAIGQHRLRQRQGMAGLIGGIDTPAKPPFRFVDFGLINRDRQGQLLDYLGACRTRPIRTYLAFLALFVYGQSQQSGQPDVVLSR